ncbi:hypothetical protein C0J52_09927 [Blattella germanica]|nr:hypothetical protein C0J52_09927 [Blattella germanica]
MGLHLILKVKHCHVLHWSAFQNFFSRVTGFLGDLVYLVHAELKKLTHFTQSGHISLLP